jgi:hypothetical protein
LAEAWYYYVTSGTPSTLPSPAMVKAMLVAHADDLYGGEDPLTSGTLPHSPSAAQGWGRVNLDATLQDEVAVTVFDEDHASSPIRRFTSAGQFWTQELEIDDSSKPFIAVLVFTDAASSPTASGSLVVNDLTLRVSRPNQLGTTHWLGNIFASGSWYSKSHAVPMKTLNDPNNTVEVIRIDGAALTVPFTLKVSAAAINDKAVPGLDGTSDNQDFALYIYNATPTP